MKKISIIVPVYNAEKTIRKCIESILNQSYNNFELIVINDGSVDDSEKIIKSYEDSRIVYINNTNHGVSYSRNCGIKKATGDYVTFVDSDDYLEKECLEKISEILINDVDVVRYNFNVDGEKSFNNNIYDLRDRKIDINDETLKVLYKHFLTFEEPIPNLVMLLFIKKDIIKKISFNEKLYMMEDVAFYLDLFANIKNIFFSDLKLYNYYVNPSSVTHAPKNYYRNIVGILETNEVILSKISKNISEQEYNKINGNHIRLISQILICQYRNSKAEYKKTIKKLINNSNFSNLLKFYKYVPSKNCIVVYLIKKRKLKITYVYLYLLDIAYKILRK